MKHLMLILVLGLVGCGSGGSGSQPSVDDGLPDGLPSTCKNLYGVWTSTTDSEAHDFTSMASGIVNLDYGYTASDASTCGYPTNSNHAVRVEITSWPTAAYDYQVEMIADLAMSGTCAYYVPPGSTGGRYGYMLIKMDICNEIEICQNYGAGTCKTFH